MDPAQPHPCEGAGSSCPAGHLTAPGIWRHSSQQLTKQTSQANNQTTSKPTHHHTLTFNRKSTKNLPNIGQKIDKSRSKSSQNRAWGLSWGFLCPLGAILAPRGPQEQKKSQNDSRGPPSSFQVGSKNPPKIDSVAFKKAIFFWIGFAVGFW